jgi:hypothetical protein
VLASSGSTYSDLPATQTRVAMASTKTKHIKFIMATAATLQLRSLVRPALLAVVCATSPCSRVTFCSEDKNERPEFLPKDKDGKIIWNQVMNANVMAARTGDQVRTNIYICIVYCAVCNI